MTDIFKPRKLLTDLSRKIFLWGNKINQQSLRYKKKSMGNENHDNKVVNSRLGLRFAGIESSSTPTTKSLTVVDNR